MITLLHLAALWMMMHQQTQDIEFRGRYWTHTYDQGPAVLFAPKSAKPEHVIEIKTKTEDHGQLRGSNCERGDTLIDPPKSDNPNIPQECVRVTKEIWLDGVKWGVLKGD